MNNLEEKDVIKIWENNSNNNTKKNETFHIYVHSPFCEGICKYCIYSSSDIKGVKKEDFNRYFRSMVNQMERLKDSISSYKIDSIYFGGGTPTLMPLDILYKISKTLPNWNQIPIKVFEANPISTNKDKIDALVELGFTYISFGVQTLDKVELKKQNRGIPRKGHLQELTRYAKDRGLHVNYDLMALLNDNTRRDSLRVYNDLRLMMQEYKPSSIDIYPDITKFNVGEKEILDQVIPLRKSIAKSLFKVNDYHLARGMKSVDISNEREILKYGPGNYHVLSMPDEEFFGGLKSYSCSGPPDNPKNQNVLSFGGYNDLWTYSYTGENKELYYSRVKENGEIEYKRGRGRLIYAR